MSTSGLICIRPMRMREVVIMPAFASGGIKDAVVETDYDYTITSSASSSSPVEEGGQITYTITRSGSGTASTVYVATNAVNTATQHVDFTHISSQAVSFASDETVKTVTVDTLTDSVYEKG